MYNVLGCKYKFSVNELTLNFVRNPINDPCPMPPVSFTFALHRGIEIEAILGTNVIDTLRSRKFIILDDLTLSLNANRSSLTSPRMLQLSFNHLNVQFSPGRSRDLMAKLPPYPPIARTIHKPALLKFWDASVSLKGASLVFNAPTQLPSCSSDFRATSLSSINSDPAASTQHVFPDDTATDVGFFLRFDHMKFDSHGMSAEERHDPMIIASVSLNGCSAGTASVDQLSQSLYEKSSDSLDLSVDNPGWLDSMDKVVAAKPELLLWMETMTVAIDINITKHHLTRADFATAGVVFAIEPVGLVQMTSKISNLIGKYWHHEKKRQQVTVKEESTSSLPRNDSSSSLQALRTEPDSIRVACDLRHFTVLVLGNGTIGEPDSLAVVASCEKLVIPQLDMMEKSVLRLTGNLSTFKLYHFSKWGTTKNADCRTCKFDIEKAITIMDSAHSQTGRLVCMTSRTTTRLPVTKQTR